MPLIDKQIQATVNMLIEGAIKRGRLPGQVDLLEELAGIQERINGSPVFRPLAVTRFDQFDVKKWNSEMQHVEFDLNILFEELISQAILLMKRTGWTDTVYRSQRGQLDRIIGTLNDILFAKQNAEDHFMGFSETFSDFSKIDLEVSTPGILSLAEEALLIPTAPMGTQRIPMEDLVREGVQGVVVNQPPQPELIRTATASDAPFSNIFHDLSLIWRHDVLTQNDLGCEIQITFPISAATAAHRITRASITPTSESEIKCQILTSIDGENFTLLPARDEWLILDRASREVAVDFESITARYIRLVLKKDSADELVDDKYRYSFGIRNFSLYTAARMPQADYQTVLLAPQFSTVEKVALEVDDFRPGGCEIDYYVSDGTGEFFPISPIGRASARAPQTIRFGDMRELKTSFFASGELAYTYNAQDYYTVNSLALTGESHFGMSQLYRGRNAWSRETSTVEEVRTNRDSYIEFTSENQKFYTYVSTTVTGEDLYALDGTSRTVLTIPEAQELYYDRNIAGHTVRPGFGVDIDEDAQPTYAVAEVLAVRSLGYIVTGETFSLSSSEWVEFANRNLDEITRPTIEWSTDENTWYDAIEDDSYVLETIPGQGDYLTGRIKMISAGNPDGGGTDPLYGRATYNVRRDVTHLVTDVNATRGQIWLAHPISADTFQIRYRIVPENIIRKSIVVTERHGEDHGIVYKEGSDYLVNVGLGAISRLGGGRIPERGVCYADFQWVEERYSLETFSVWCFFDKTEPEIIRFSAPSLDKDNGETFYMDVNGGRVDLVEAGETPILTRGWYRFTVESKVITDADAGIRKVLALVNTAGEPVFSGTAFFSEIRAFRAPMSQVSEAKMKFGTRKSDHTTFTIDPDGFIVVNFNPGASLDITTLIYNKDTGLLDERDEYFELLRVTSSGQTANGVKVRAILRRNPNVDPGTTPKVFGWALRISR